MLVLSHLFVFFCNYCHVTLCESHDHVWFCEGLLKIQLKEVSWVSVVHGALRPATIILCFVHTNSVGDFMRAGRRIFRVWDAFFPCKCLNYMLSFPKERLKSDLACSPFFFIRGVMALFITNGLRSRPLSWWFYSSMVLIREVERYTCIYLALVPVIRWSVCWSSLPHEVVHILCLTTASILGFNLENSLSWRSRIS